ncbi:GIY-YIG nuclease family protein [Paenibacillus dakarensis]|uniref:GIY-YIG nuclease family protein n=1 Tax=Paenibacillus dakarensis TaxID=1527293 RepID=UPI0006D54565|nr:GIY-YIG nuclease family protein [Paenibacillus dakarensis]
MNRREELKQMYKEIKIEAGVYQIKNTKNGKVLVVGTPNLKTINGKRFELQMGTSINKPLQQDWNEYGEDAFVFEILEVIEPEKDPFFNMKETVSKREEHWISKLQSFGEGGYNSAKRV